MCHLTHFKNLNLRALFVAAVLTLTSSGLIRPERAVAFSEEQQRYLTCTDFKFVFARGSGAEVGSDRDFKPFKSAVDQVFGGSEYSYSLYELGTVKWSGYAYPAPGIGISSFARISTSIDALGSGGTIGAYGESIEDGAAEALSYIAALKNACPSTKVVFAGYSQGAHVVSRTLQIIPPSQIFAALTFGDPKLYLPEGETTFFNRTPAACHNQNLSEYRAYVPDCYAYQGILGGYNPYQYSASYSGKLKAYCQFHDVICSSFVDFDKLVSGHATYAEQGTYVRGIQDVYNMVTPATYSRPAQDVAILFDNTGSMGPLLASFQAEAIRVARRTLEFGGHVALYTYGDLEDSTPTELCNFSTCTTENISALIRGIVAYGGGDDPESLLSASYTLMKRLNWQVGANKSLIVLTDAGYHNPDRDGITLDQVVELSKSIDPVNFYILTPEENAEEYAELAERTDGAVYNSALPDSFGEIESEILSRQTPALYVSTTLPAYSLATLSNFTLTKTSASSVRVDFAIEGGSTALVLLDSELIGYSSDSSFEIKNLDLSQEHLVCLAPVSDTGYRGETACLSTDGATAETVLPKAPNTGRK